MHRPLQMWRKLPSAIVKEHSSNKLYICSVYIKPIARYFLSSPNISSGGKKLKYSANILVTSGARLISNGLLATCKLSRVSYLSLSGFARDS